MTPTDALPPITAATIVSVFLFAGAWRGHQIEKATGRDPWWLAAGIAVYGVPVAAFLYLRKGTPLASGLDLFATALAAQAFGVGIVYALLSAFVFTRGQPWRERAMPMVAAVVLTAGMIAGLFAPR